MASNTHVYEDGDRPAPNLPVGIIGAGMAGLYTAMIFESLGIKYQIVDANFEHRVGGRLFTYRFPNGGHYDYFDVGAMRLFKLAEKKELGVKLIPYIMDMPYTFLFYNNVRVYNQDCLIVDDHFKVSDYAEKLKTPEDAEKMISEVLRPFRDLFKPRNGKAPNISDAMSKLLDQAVGWCETLDKSSGWYDRALAETVIESLAFNWPTAELTHSDPSKSDPEPPHSGLEIDWHSIDGGSSTLQRAIFNSLSEDAQKSALFRNTVTGIFQSSDHMEVMISETKQSQHCSAVISTIPLPRLSLLRLEKCDFGQRCAIRELQYTLAIKIGIKFKTPCVYPSYPHEVTAKNMSTVLIASFCWTQDAQRMGARMNGDGTMRPKLFDLVFRDLAAVHDVTSEWLLERYAGQHFAWDWLHDPLTMCAFALFGPGSYERGGLYDEIVRPAANGKPFLAGEATSSCHGWVAGALNSAWRAVDQCLALNQSKGLRKKFWDEWGPTEFWDDISDDELVKLEAHLNNCTFYKR